jgi:hypothetical protein
MDILRRHAAKFTLSSSNFESAETVSIPNTEARNILSWLYVFNGSIEIKYTNGDSMGSLTVDEHTLTDLRFLKGRHLTLVAGNVGASWLAFSPSEIQDDYSAEMLKVTSSEALTSATITTELPKYVIALDTSFSYKNNIIDQGSFLTIPSGKTVELTVSEKSNLMVVTPVV